VNSLPGERAAEQPLILPVSRQVRRVSSGKHARSRTVSDDFAALLDAVSHHRADHNGVGIHYATLGQGPLLVMIHGWPDCWYTWRRQMPVLAQHYRVAAMDLRGYNLSDQPAAGEAYRMRTLMGDVEAVIRDQGQQRAIIMAHDWGGMIAWSLAMHAPHLVSRLIICNLPHPWCLVRELAAGGAQFAASEYARRFQAPDSHLRLDTEKLLRVLPEQAPREAYREAFERSSLNAMMHYYRENFAQPPYQLPAAGPSRVTCPVLMCHGLDDIALRPETLNDTWRYLAGELTLVTIPGAGHWVQEEAWPRVNRVTLDWLQGLGTHAENPGRI
jgi:pimeloyl-ACP methyl ester carboxylesterase